MSFSRLDLVSLKELLLSESETFELVLQAAAQVKDQEHNTLQDTAICPRPCLFGSTGLPVGQGRLLRSDYSPRPTTIGLR